MCFFPESIESPYRLMASDKTSRELNLKITHETKIKKTKDTFLQWHAKGSCLSYGAQLASSQQLDKVWSCACVHVCVRVCACVCK